MADPNQPDAAANPLLATFNLSTHPLDGDIDLSTSAGIKAFNRALDVDESEGRIDLTVANSKQFYQRIKHKVNECRLHKFMLFPTQGSGVPVVTNATRANQHVDLNAFGEFKNILTEHSSISLQQCQEYAQYNWGDNLQTRSIANGLVYAEIDPLSRIDGVDDNHELKRLIAKQQYRIRSEMTSAIIQGIIAKRDWDLLVESEESAVTFVGVDGSQKIDGFLLLKVVLDDIKPEVVVEVRELEEKLESLTLAKCDNNVHIYTRTAENLWREIQREKPGSYDEDRFTHVLFRGLNTSTNADFKAFLKPLKTSWTLRRDNVNYARIITEANTLFKTMTADEEWTALSEDQLKIVALTTKLEKAQKSIQALQTKAEAPRGSTGDGANQNGSKTGADANKTDWEKEKIWRCKKQGKTLKKDGKEFVWCDHHNDEKGMYMPKGHNHEQWKKDKEKKKEEAKAKKAERRGQRDRSTTPQTTPSTATGKLALAKHLTEALTTKIGVSDADAEKLVEDILKSSKA